MKSRILNKFISLIKKIDEELYSSSLPTNNVGSQLKSGNPITIAGLPPDNPVIRKRIPKKGKKDNKIYLGSNSRKPWMR